MTTTSLEGIKRVHVIGGGGSGKSTLARHLAERLGVPHVDLDVPGSDLAALLDSPAWVGDGIYIWGLKPVLDRADLIVWLDLPRRVAIRRIVVRHVRLSATGQNRHKGLRKLYRFASGQRDYYTAPAREPTGPTDFDALTRAATELLLQDRPNVVRLRTPRQVRTWLNEMR